MGAKEENKCIPCSGTKPQNSEWIRGGKPYWEDNCKWECNEGYVQESDQCKKQNEVNAEVIVDSPPCTKSQESCFGEGKGKVDIVLKLSTKPAKDVIITLRPDHQLKISSEHFVSHAPKQIRILKSDWDKETVVSVEAYDDASPEDTPHFGDLDFDAESDDDAYNAIPIDSITFGISDNDCRELISPAHASLIGVLGTAWALDKCPTAGAAHEWRELSVNELATVRCCSDEQPKTVCKSRKKPGGECLPEKATYVEAEQACAEVQMRLCTKKELQDICCGTGCGYNNNVVWSRRDNANSQDCGNSHDSACRFLCLFVRGSHPWLV